MRDLNYPILDRLRESTETVTIRKSNMFHGSLMYDNSPLNTNPYTVILTNISNENAHVITMSRLCRIYTLRVPYKSSGFSSARSIVEIIIKHRIVLSKY